MPEQHRQQQQKLDYFALGAPDRKGPEHFILFDGKFNPVPTFFLVESESNKASLHITLC